MIDLHAHILPGLDDGAVDMDEAIRMCRVAESDGIDTIVATPHTGNGVYMNGRDCILAAVADLNRRLREEGMSVKILPGADVHVNHDMAGMLAAGNAMTVNDRGRFMMVELPHHMIPPNFQDWIFALKLKGITPIITHPERNLSIKKHMEELHAWVKLGALVQITAMSLTGHFGDGARQSAREMLKGNLVHFIATDAHSVKHRPPVLSRARDAAAKLIGETEADHLVVTNPRSILEGKPVDSSALPKCKEPSIMSRFFSSARNHKKNVLFS